MKKPRAKAAPLPQADLFDDGAPLAQAPRQSSLRAQLVPSRARTPRATTPVVTPPPTLLNVREAAARLGLSKSTLDKMRCTGNGPRFIKSTDRAVRYDPVDLDAWIAGRRRNKTSTD